jgi:threonine dehydratase
MTFDERAAFLRAVKSSPVYDLARETALQRARKLSARFRLDVWLKREDQQVQYSFKVRGALHAIASLTPAVRARGVVTASAGNHAQGVALAARHFGVAATVVMPRATPAIKVEAVRALDARVVLDGERFADAEAVARDLAAGTAATLVHPYDDRRVIEGQATVAAEILRQHAASLDAVLVPVGGGGLIAGVGAYLQAFCPDVQVIGVEPVDSDAMYRALAAGRPVPVEHPGMFADGVAVRQVGREPFALAQGTVTGVIRVTRAQICDAMRAVFEDTRGIVEPAGALAVAALEAYSREYHRGRGAVVALLTGGNVDFDVLGEVARQTDAIEPVAISAAASS